MSTTSNEDKESNKDRTKTRAEPGVVVSSTLPLGEAIAQEMIITFSARATEDVCHYAQACESIAGSFGGSFDLCLSRSLANMNTWLL